MASFLVTILLASPLTHALQNVTLTPLSSSCSNYPLDEAPSPDFTGDEYTPPFCLTPSDSSLVNLRSTFANFTGLNGPSSSSNLILGSNPLITRSHLTCKDSQLIYHEFSLQTPDTPGNVTKQVSFTDDGRLAHDEKGRKPELYKLAGNMGHWMVCILEWEEEFGEALRHTLDLARGAFSGLICGCWNSVKAQGKGKKRDF